jgi:hypothetical protein
MEHLRIDHQVSPVVAEGLAQSMFHYVYVRGRCSLVELFPINARKEGFLQALHSLLASKHLYTDLKSIWAREKQVVFTETPLGGVEETDDTVLRILNAQRHFVGEDFTHAGAININRDFQLQWYKMSMKPGDAFHLGHFYDFRGRIYPKGHILTYQGTDFQKSLVRCDKYELRESEMAEQLREHMPNYLEGAGVRLGLTPHDLSPKDWILVDMARSFGLDKETWSDRLAWAYSHTHHQVGAKEPFLYHSAQAASYASETDHLVSLDATASGIQCLALMAQDPESARAVNLGTNVVNNPYQRVNDHMGAYPYDRVKKAVMTSFYESVKTPKDLFGDDYQKFVDAASKMLPGPWALKEAISSCMDSREFYSWTMMDGFTVNMEVTTPVECTMDIGGMDMTWTEHRRAPVATKGLTANVTHSLDALVLREVLRRTNVRGTEWNNNVSSELREQDVRLGMSILRWRESQFLTFEFLDHMDDENGGLVPQELRDAVDSRLARNSMYVQPIHDCYRVKATDAGVLFNIHREVMADLAYAKTALWLLPQIGYKGRINDDESKRAALKDQVLESQYLIC